MDKRELVLGGLATSNTTKSRNERLDSVSRAWKGFAIVSLILNTALIVLWPQKDALMLSSRSISGLGLSTEVTFGRKTAYGDSNNLKLTDDLWYSMDTSLGVVALPKDAHLGSSYTFPWDDTKSVYVLNGYHSLHCLVRMSAESYDLSRLTEKKQAVYKEFRRYQQNLTDVSNFGHVLHCLDVLRSDIMCSADDTPLSFEFQDPEMSEWPPKRRCRDWSQFETFAKRNSACFRRFSPSDPRYSTLAEFTYCPDGSEYQQIAEEFKELDED